MPLPEPQPGLVVSYLYLWHHEHRVGRDAGRKARPCVIILAVEREDDAAIMVRVAPVTHSAPDDVSAALELPLAVKRHLGLDDERSWVILDEVNEFGWPGFDLRHISRSRDTYAYGFLPPRLFDQLIAMMGEIWARNQGKAASRD